MTNREIDNLVAEKILEWDEKDFAMMALLTGTNPDFSPSTRMQDAELIKIKLSDNFTFELNTKGNDKEAIFWSKDTETGFGGSDETEAMAICLAGLKAVGTDLSEVA
ncbi:MULTISPECIES: BC1872 family protein [Bacillus cereus group]|uniref:BC1872 family protein n=1 Tax=Bacillus cereus group TaxID=86661 RepID=UPI0022E1ED47|nr:hypothetical protein [Bacillus cereus group sp. TH152-1LC]MDA1674646.1 hypothetical protein [Bacillus cereus group sp. TH152-1LC]